MVLATGGYGNVFFLSTNAMASNVTAAWRAYKQGAGFANPCFVQIHPTCIPVHGDYQSKLTLMSESLRNDGRVWVPAKRGRQRRPRQRSPRRNATITWRRNTRASAIWCPAMWPPATPRNSAMPARASAKPDWPSISILPRPSNGTARRVILKKYGNLFQMYEKITDKNPYREPMMIYPAVHYTMGGLWVDYDLMTTIPGLFALGESNFSDHGANRLGASALMQGLADGYFICHLHRPLYRFDLGDDSSETDQDAFDESGRNVGAGIHRLLRNSMRGPAKKG